MDLVKLVDDAYQEIGKGYSGDRERNTKNYDKYGICINKTGCKSYDCSSFVSSLYKRQGINIGVDTKTIANSTNLETISKDNIKAGDILVWYELGTHMSLATGNGTHISAEGSKLGVVEMNLFKKTVINGEIYTYYTKGDLLKVLRLK